MKIHHLSTEEAFSSMQSAPSGLTSQEARRRLAEYGPNDVEKVPRQPLLLQKEIIRVSASLPRSPWLSE